MNPLVTTLGGGVSQTSGRSPSRFRRFSVWTARGLGSPWAFACAVLACVVWGATGPIFHYSDTWQLVINTATNLVTFLMVFVIQNSQNREATAMHLKLDELIRATERARTQLINLDELDDEELERLQAQFKRIGQRAEAAAERKH